MVRSVTPGGTSSAGLVLGTQRFASSTPITSKFAHRSVRDFYGSAKLPSRPTCAPAGSPEKVKVLIARATAGLSLHHPNDSKELHIPTLQLKPGNRRVGGHKRKTHAF